MFNELILYIISLWTFYTVCTVCWHGSGPRCFLSLLYNLESWAQPSGLHWLISFVFLMDGIYSSLSFFWCFVNWWFVYFQVCLSTYVMLIFGVTSDRSWRCCSLSIESSALRWGAICGTYEITAAFPNETITLEYSRKPYLSCYIRTAATTCLLVFVCVTRSFTTWKEGKMK